MKRSVVLLLLLCSLTFVRSTFPAEPTHKVEVLKEAPTGLAPDIVASLNGQGFRIAAAGKTACDVWLAKTLPVKAGFKPTDTIKYSFTPGQLIGAIRFPEKTIGGDYRGQEIEPGIYTLRYGLQPNDGNHLGTSDVRDFLLACPAKKDIKPDVVAKKDDLFKLSSQSAGTTHPTIFLLLPPADEPLKQPELKHDDEKDLWILGINVAAQADDKPVQIPLRLVTIGKSAG